MNSAAGTHTYRKDNLNDHSNDNNKAITSAIVAMAERLDLRTVAECVEKREQVAILGEMQCQAAQGFYFAEPLTQEKLAEWLGGRLEQRPTGSVVSED